MSEYKQERVGNFIQTYTGRFFFPLDPRKEDITLLDIAHSLSNLCRFTGHAKRFYSVGEHSIKCVGIARKLGFSTLQQLYCLGHDASESVVNDLARPVKQDIQQYKEIENNIMKVMWEVLGLPQPTKEDYEKVKLVDNTILVNEINQLMGNKNYRPHFLHANMYVNLDGGYGAGVSKEDFIFLYKELMKEL